MPLEIVHHQCVVLLRSDVDGRFKEDDDDD